MTTPDDVKRGRERRELSRRSFNALNQVTAILIEAARENRSDDVRAFATGALEQLERFQQEQLQKETIS